MILKKASYTLFLILMAAMLTGCDSPTGNSVENDNTFVVFQNSGKENPDSYIHSLIEKNVLEESQIKFRYKNKISGISAELSQSQIDILNGDEHEDSEIIPGQFIIVFIDPFDGEKFATEEGNKWAMYTISKLQIKYDISDDQVLHRYGYALFGFTAKLSDKQLYKLDQEDLISYIEPDKKFSINY